MALRQHIHRHRRRVIAMMIAALAIVMLVPTGYMPGIADGAFVMRPCAAQHVQTGMAEAPLMSGDHAHSDHNGNKGSDQMKQEMPCVFSGWSVPGLATIDPVLLAIAIAFVLAAAFRAAPTPLLSRGIHLRPPSQGPPATV